MPRAETRLSEEDKRAWVAFCKQAGIKESQMLRQMILKVSRGTDSPPPEADKDEPKTSKVTVRLSKRERQQILDRVAQEGFSNPTQWATALVRSALHREPVLTASEISALRASNRELAAIGRNLNQVARALNIEFRDSDKLKQDDIEKLADRIEQHKDLVAGLLSRNMNRWGDDG